MRFRAARWQKISRMSSTLFETERRGILPVTVRGSATEKADFARKVWWYFKGVFGGIVGIDE